MPASYDVRQQVLAIKPMVVEHFTEENWLELGVLTGGSDSIQGHGRLLRSLHWSDPDYGGCVLDVLMQIVDDDERNLQTVERYLDEKFGTGGVNISSTPAIGARIYFTPSAFVVPDDAPDPNLISVMMPFDGALTAVYTSIGEVSTFLHLTCKRADNVWEHSTVVQDVFGLIFRSYIVVCDFSGRNPNVFYEAGIAHTLGKHVVPITQNPDDIPFDLRHHRYIRYLNNAEGRLDLQQKLQDRFEYLIANR